MTSKRLEHEQLVRTFQERCHAIGAAADERLFWYHTIDLGQGVITPGSFDYRENIRFYQFPERMDGLRVLDVGSATGFFAFELERRGARVTSVEIPSFFQWDRFPGESSLGILDKIRALLAFHSTQSQSQIDAFFSSHSPAQIYHFLLDGPFHFCHRFLQSGVQRVYSSVYELGSELPSNQGYDYVLASDVLLHLIDPLGALAVLARLCSGTLVLAQSLAADGPPAMHYVGGASPRQDAAEWWRPNFAWFEQVLRKLDFNQVIRGPSFVGTSRPGGESFDKTVIHAYR
jgi:tRNA (mo5U34)-methyltransferase